MQNEADLKNNNDAEALDTNHRSVRAALSTQRASRNRREPSSHVIDRAPPMKNCAGKDYQRLASRGRLR